MFSGQHLTASGALAPAFNQRCPASLNQLAAMCLQALSTPPNPMDNPRGDRI